MFSFKLELIITWASSGSNFIPNICTFSVSRFVFFYLSHSSPLTPRIHVFQTFPSPFYQEWESKA